MTSLIVDKSTSSWPGSKCSVNHWKWNVLDLLSNCFFKAIDGLYFPSPQSVFQVTKQPIVTGSTVRTTGHALVTSNILDLQFVHEWHSNFWYMRRSWVLMEEHIVMWILFHIFFMKWFKFFFAIIVLELILAPGSTKIGLKNPSALNAIQTMIPFGWLTCGHTSASFLFWPNFRY